MQLSSNEVESRNYYTQLTIKPLPLSLSSDSVPVYESDDICRECSTLR